MHTEIFSSLSSIPFLTNVPESDLQVLATQTKTATFPKQAFIITEGDETGSLYILLSGKVRVFSSDEHGKEVTLNILEPGSYFGELALLDEQPRSVSVITLEKSVCGVISRSGFKRWLAEHPEAAVGLIQELSMKVRSLTDKVKSMALSNVYERTIKVLKDMAVEKDGLLLIAIRPTQQELANMVGSSREMINKIMKELDKGDYIITEGKSMKILKQLPSSW